MDLLQMQYFSKVYETRNYTKASESLYISRQALSRSVRGLEHEIGRPLFKVVDNKLSVTPEAHSLYQAITPLLREYQNLKSSIDEIRRIGGDAIHMGQSYDANDILSKREVRAYSRSPFEGLAVDASLVTYRVDTDNKIRQMLLDGELDYAQLVICSYDESLFDFTCGRKGRLHLAVHDECWLANQEEVCVDDLKGLPMAVQCEGNDVREALFTQARMRGFDIDARVMANSLHYRLQWVETMGYATYCYREASYENVAPHAVFIPFKEASLDWMHGVLAKRGYGDPSFKKYFAGLENYWDDFLAE